MIRKAKAAWRGTGRDGDGDLTTDSGVLTETPFSFKTRFENGKGTIRGKAWAKSDKEPAAWTVEVTDSHPIAEGSAALYGYVTGGAIEEKNPGPEVYFDNVRITPNNVGAKTAALDSAPPLDWFELSRSQRRPLLPRLRR